MALSFPGLTSLTEQKKLGLVSVLPLTNWASLFISLGFSLLCCTMERGVVALSTPLSCDEG